MALPGNLDPQKFYVTPTSAQAVNIHSGPGEQFAIWSSATIGQLLEVVEDSTQAAAKIGMADQWIQVKDAQGNIGWVGGNQVDVATFTVATPGRAAPVYIPPTPATPIVVAPVAPQPYQPPVSGPPIYVHTTLPTGQWIRSGPDQQQPAKASIEISDRCETVGDPVDAANKLGKYPQWIQIKTSQGIIGWAAAWYLERFPDYFIWSVGHALVGLHGSTETWADRWDEQAFQIIGQAKIEAVKMLAANTLSADPGALANIINRLKGLNVRFLMARLFAKFDVFKTPQDFVNEVLPDALALYNLGVNYFEVHNEPNLSIMPGNPEGMFVVWNTGAAFGDFFTQSVAILKQHLPNAKFGFPGLSPAPEMPKQIYRADTFLTEAATAIQSADFVCMHTYWGGDGSGYLNSIAAIRSFCQKYPNKLIFVTEFANTSTSVGKDVKGREYAAFYNEAKKLPANLGALFSYALTSAGNDPEQMWTGSSIAQLVGERLAV